MVRVAVKASRCKACHRQAWAVRRNKVRQSCLGTLRCGAVLFGEARSGSLGMLCSEGERPGKVRWCTAVKVRLVLKWLVKFGRCMAVKVVRGVVRYGFVWRCGVSLDEARQFWWGIVWQCDAWSC